MGDISQIKLPDNTTYNINAKTVNGHTVGTDVPSSAVFTDQYVKQISSMTEDDNYRILLSGTASDNTQTETVRKSPTIKINPKYDAITIGYDRASGSAYGVCSLTQGSNIIASGQYSHGEGWWTIANHRSQHVFGEYNIADASSATVSNRGNYVEIVGNGTENSRSNARTLDWSGNETLAGSLRLAGTTSDIHLTGTDNYWYGTTTSLKTAVSSLEHDLSDLTPLEKTASGAIATFDDGSDLPMPKLEVAIEPQQDLHGYDYPWVGGAGKNKLPMTVSSVKANNTEGTWSENNYTQNGVTFSLITDNGENITGIKVSGIASANTYFFVATNLQNTISHDGTMKINGCSGGSSTTYALQVYFESGFIDCFDGDKHILASSATKQVVMVVRNGYAIPSGGITFYPMICLATETDATFKPYSNICPISGWSEVNVTRCGKNLIDKAQLIDNRVVNSTGQEVSASTSWCVTPPIKINANDSYYLTNGIGTLSMGTGCLYDKNMTFLRTVSLAGSGTQSGIINTGNDSVYLRLNILKTEKDSVQLELGSISTEYHAYNGHTYTIDLDGTRYGGTLDVVSGVLTVDREFNTFTELPSQYADVGNDIVCAFIQSNNMKANSRNDGLSNYFSPTTTIIGQNNPWRVCFGINNKRIYFTFDPEVIGGNTLQNINNYVAINPIQVVYPLATPITYQLTPTQVNSLLGVNNIWADTGDIEELVYFRNAKSTQAIRDIIDTITAKDIAFTKYKGLPTNVQDAINQTYDNVSALNNNMADGYLERQSYSVDDYVRYEDSYYGGYNLYRCIERSDGGSFDYNKWTKVNIGDELTQIKQSLSYFKDCQSTFSNSAWQGVYYADYDISSIVNQGYKATGIIPTDVNSNRPCYGYLYANGAMARVCTTSTDIGGTTVKFRVTFQKGESL